VTDLVMALADAHDAPLAIANDPDADRLCICARDAKGKMRQMTGDQLGSLLGDALIKHYRLFSHLGKSGTESRSRAHGDSDWLQVAWSFCFASSREWQTVRICV
jgi:hypothetical protein